MHISDYLKNTTIEKPLARTEEDEIITSFLNELVSEYEIGPKFYMKEEKKVKRLKPTFMQVKMKLYAIRKSKLALLQFLSDCKDYKHRHGSFGKCFYGATKIK